MVNQYPLGNEIVPYGTPLHVVELFLQLLKLVFSNLPEDHPYHFDNDNYENNNIAFDVSLNKESDIYGKKPIVVVSRGGQNSVPNDLGDYAAGKPLLSIAKGSNLLTGEISFQVVGRIKAEVEVISQIIFGTLMMRRTHMPELLNIHMVQSIMLSEVSKFEEDDTLFIAQGGFSYIMQYIWSQRINDPVLRSISIAVSKMCETN